MRVSEKFNLGADQAGLDFVDVDVTDDVPVFIDPTAIRVQKGRWAYACQEDLQSFFQCLLKAIASGDRAQVKRLVSPLVEPNETHLGLSRGESRGRGLGNARNSDRLIDALTESKAASTGLLSDLEDTVLFIPGIGRDIISDITTCIIRGRLIEYTQQMCDFHEIPLVEQYAPPVWNSSLEGWSDSEPTRLPRVDGDILILVPKSIVRVRLSMKRSEYYRGFLRPIYEEIEVNTAGSNLVNVLKSGKRKVRLGELDKKLGTGKEALVANSEPYPEALDAYRKHVRDNAASPMNSSDLADTIGTPLADYQALLDEVLAIAPGNGGANPYHRAIEKLLSALFETSLGNAHIETELHEGLKRIDITYDNIAERGFFRWLSLHYSSATFVVECKNYGRDVGNPEVDQIAMRFADRRGNVGILTIRESADRARLIRRCKAVARDGHGYVLVLDDNDLKTLVEEAKAEVGSGRGERSNHFRLLKDQFNELINS